MQHREVACALLIDTFDRLLLQQRDNIPGILHPGTVGLFGGHREGGESYLECVVREIQEEVSYYVGPGLFRHIASYDDPDVDGHGGSLHGEFFLATDIPIDRMRVTEGTLLVVKRNEIATVDPKFAPATRFVMKVFQTRFNV